SLDARAILRIRSTAQIVAIPPKRSRNVVDLLVSDGDVEGQRRARGGSIRLQEVVDGLAIVSSLVRFDALTVARARDLHRLSGAARRCRARLGRECRKRH